MTQKRSLTLLFAVWLVRRPRRQNERRAPKTATKPIIHAATVSGDGNDDDLKEEEACEGAIGCDRTGRLDGELARTSTMSLSAPTISIRSSAMTGFFIFPPFLGAFFADKSLIVNISWLNCCFLVKVSWLKGRDMKCHFQSPLHYAICLIVRLF